VASYPRWVPASALELTPAQREAVEHPAGPLLIAGGAGTGKTTTLLARVQHLAASRAAAPEALLTLTFSTAAAAELRAALEGAIDTPYEELSVTTVPDLCARLLRDEAHAAGLDPFVVPVTPADRLAMLLDRQEDLSLRRHDFRGNPASLLGSFVRRIDRLKDELVTWEACAEWAAGLGDDEEGEREREFAAVYREHDAMLSRAGTLDFGDLVLRTHALLTGNPEVRARAGERYAHVLVDDYQDCSAAQVALVELIASGHGNLTVAGDDDSAISRHRGAGAKNLRDFRARHGERGRVVRLERSLRSPERVLGAAHAVVAPIEDRLGLRLEGEPGGEVAFWRCANERAQAQAIAADVERAIVHEGAAPASIAILVRSVRTEAQAIAAALEERGVPHRIEGAAAFFQRAEIRDVLAWLRLLANPGDAGAVVRALARAPIELRSVDIARCTQIARRRKVDMVSALVAATESPQVPPEARERILQFLKLYRSAAAALDTTRPDLYVHRLIERLGLRRQQLFAAQAEVVERLVNLARFGELAAQYVRRTPQATPREFAAYIAAVAEAGLREHETPSQAVEGAVSVLAMHAARGRGFDHVYVAGLHGARMPGARQRTVEPIPDALLPERLPPDSRAAHVESMRRLLYVACTRARRRLVLAYPAHADASDAAQPPSPFLEEARAALGGAEFADHEEELFGPAETLHSTYRMLRDELLDTVQRTGSRLGELRFDTDLDVSHAVVRYLELIKLSALISRPEGQEVAEALAQVNDRLLGAATAEQREIFLTSALDEYLLDAERGARRRAEVVAKRDEPSLEAFLPRRGDGLLLSASDVETYRICPLRYKFARVFRIPQEPTTNQRFGILVHQVLERFHQAGGPQTRAELLGLLDGGWRRHGFGDGDEDRQLRSKAEVALTKYHDRFAADPAEPVWFERSFAFKLGPHHLRGRVDRVDRLPGGGYELIDYKTGRPKTASQLKDDVQLSLYAVGAREAWDLDAAQQAYYYVLDDEKVPVPRDDTDRDSVTETVLRVAEGIQAQGFEPTPSYSACSTCDYRIICPAAER
jgi:DNA helicase-2/ATP-dependent DNA helicase PcrA